MKNASLFFHPVNLGMVGWLGALLAALASELEAGLAVVLEGGLGWWLWTGALAFGGVCGCASPLAFGGVCGCAWPLAFGGGCGGALQGGELPVPSVGLLGAAALCFGTSGDAIGLAFAVAVSSSFGANVELVILLLEAV